MLFIESKIIDGIEYRLVTLRGRSKYVARDGTAFNPYKVNRKATVHINPDGYPCFGGGVPVHLYVAHAWVEGKQDGLEVDHIDYDRMNYNYSNLRWVSHKENVKHSSSDENHYAEKHGGSKNGRAVLSEDEVATIRQLYDSGLKTYEVIMKLHPEADAHQRKRLWNRYNRIKTKETWN